MASGKYCKYCHHFWKNIREYDKHASCCEYFYHQRRNTQPEMDEHGIRMPSMRELYGLVKDLSYRLERTERELRNLKNVVNSKQKRAILEWLNQPAQIPAITFEGWWREIKAKESDILKVISRDLTEGILSCLDANINTMKPPIRCFAQKPNTFYIYTEETGRTSSSSQPDGSVVPVWRIMNHDQMEKMALHISQSLLREFLVWQKTQQQQISEFDERSMDKTVNFMMKINGNGMALEKRLVDVKKWLFAKIEENLRVVMECDFE